jgi:hypothetical protein
MPKWIHCNNLFFIIPLREWSNVSSWFGIGKIRPRDSVSVSHLTDLLIEQLLDIGNTTTDPGDAVASLEYWKDGEMVSNL